MTSQLSHLLVLILMLGLGLYWWSAQGVKDVALRATQAYCRKMDLQMLDGCVALSRLWFKRDERGTMRVWRSYEFEFSSTGLERYRGRILLLGRKVLSIQIEPHRI